MRFFMSVSAMFRSLSVLLALGLAACASSPQAPLNNPLPAVLPPVEASIISMPITVDLEQLRIELLKQLPSPLLVGTQTQVLRVKLNPAGNHPPLEPGSCSITELDCLAKKAGKAITLDYTVPVETIISYQVFVRDLAMSMVGNQFSVTAHIEFSVNTRLKSSIAQFGVASCGINEAMPRLEFSLSGSVSRGPTGDLLIAPKPYAVKWRRHCAITAFNLNVEALLNLPVLREKLQESIQAEVFNGLHQVSLHTLLAKAWPELNAPREIQPKVWLLAHPSGVAFADLVGNGRYVSTGILVRAYPEVITGAKPAFTVPPVPVPERGINGNSMHLAIRGDIALSDAEVLLNQRVAKKPMTVNGRVVQVESIRLYGHEDKAVLGLSLSQPVQAEIFLLGKPVFDVEKNEIRFDSLSYSLGSRDFLVKSANWLLGSSFRDTLQQKARFSFDDDLADALKDFRAYRQALGQGLVLTGGISRVRPQALYFTQDRLLGYVMVDGHLNMSMDVDKIAQ